MRTLSVKPADRELGAAVRGLQRDGPVGERRPHLHHRAVVARHHPVQRRHGAVHGAEVGHLRRPAELIGIDVDELREHGRHGVVHPHVDGTELAFGLLCRRLDRGGVGDVGRDHQRVTAQVVDLASGVTQAVLAAGEKRDTRAAPREGVGDRAPHAARGAGHNHDFVFTVGHRVLLAECAGSRSRGRPAGSTLRVARRSARREASAMMVSAGLALPWVGQTLPSATNRLGTAHD